MILRKFSAIHCLLFVTFFPFQVNALELQKGKTQPLIKQAQERATRGDLEGAENLFLQALAENPNSLETQFGSQLTPFSLPKGLSTDKAWQKGQSLDGKTLLVYSVKGSGDTLQFSRFIKDLKKKKAKKVFFVTQKGLSDLLKTSFEKEVDFPLVVKEDLSLLLTDNEYDLHASLLSLPDLLGIQLSEISGKPYLKALNGGTYKSLFSKDTLNVGVVFSGEKTHPHNKDRSFSPELFKDLASLPKIKFYSLQPGSESELSSLNKKGTIVDTTLLKLLKTYNDTAEIMSQLDAVVTADTSACHLSAALGRVTLVPLSKKTDLRYVGSGKTTFWYDSMSLLRQEKQGDWSKPFAEIKTDLSSLYQKKISSQ